MTVKELIEQLQKLPPKTHVFTHGYEAGLCDCEIVDSEDIIDIALNYNEGIDCFGPHGALYGYYERNKAKELNLTVVKGVVL